MQKNIRRILSVGLALAMTASMAMPLTAYAVSEPQPPAFTEDQSTEDETEPTTQPTEDPADAGESESQQDSQPVEPAEDEPQNEEPEGKAGNGITDGETGEDEELPEDEMNTDETDVLDMEDAEDTEIEATPETATPETAENEAEIMDIQAEDDGLMAISLPDAEVKAPAPGADNHHFYDQLTTSESKAFYAAMKKLHDEHKFLTGTEAIDLTQMDNGITQEQAAAHAAGTINLFNEYGAARDAFYMDYPSIFYVDFSNLTVRITKEKENGQYHVTLGAGRFPTYYSSGFSDAEGVAAAIEEYNAALDNAVNEVKQKGGEDRSKLISAAHDYVIMHTTYRMENTASADKAAYVRNAYGSLVKGEGVCEAYTRAFKAILDQLGIPCVMVMGVYQHTADQPEQHIWNEVQMEDGKWYAVDCTMDDPYSKSAVDGVDGYECSEFRLVGNSTMSRHHVESPIMSGSNYSFSYPTIEMDDFGLETIRAVNGLVVNQNDGMLEGTEGGVYHVSYNGHGVRKMRTEDNAYMLVRYYITNDEGEWEYTDWQYVIPEQMDLLMESDHDDEIVLPMPHVQYIEFGVTDIAHKPWPEDTTHMTLKEIEEITTFTGDPFALLADTGMLKNEGYTYKAPPYIRKITPSMAGRLTIEDGTQHVVAQYDDVLVKADDEVEPYLVLESYDKFTDNKVTAVENSDISGFSWEGNTIQFDFTPSKMWSDDTVMYVIHVKGLVGQNSGKAPNDISYIASHRCAAYAYQAQGFDWNVFGKPTLLDNSDLSLDGWETADGSSIAEDLTHRMVLVATSTNRVEQEIIDEALEDKQGISEDDIYASETYNINLTLCKSQIIKTGQGVRISLGFPEGYGPDDEGVTFKAYHFTKDEYGNVVSVEEIPCVITRYGLVVTCYSFSPITIVAMDSDNADDTSHKLVLVGAEGGIITSSSADATGTISLNEGEQAEITVHANDGYVIDALTLDGVGSEIEDDEEQEHTLTVRYDELSTVSSILSAAFVTKTVAQETPGTSIIDKVKAPDSVSIESTEISAGVGDSVDVKVTVSPDSSTYTYQWYKADGPSVHGQAAATLHFDSITEADAGEYYVVVTNSSGGESASTQSGNRVTISVHTHTGGHATCEEQAVCDTCRKPYGELGPHTGGVANCTTPAVCEVCGQHYGSIDPTNHVDAATKEPRTHVTGAVEATCTEAGHEGDTVCSICGEVIKTGKTIPAKGHAFGAVKNAKDPTCTEKGYSGDRECSVCKFVEKGHDIEMLPHTYGSDGKCTRCGAVKPKDQPAQQQQNQQQNQSSNSNSNNSNDTATPTPTPVPGAYTPQKPTPPKTADEFPYVLWGVLAVVSLIGVTTAAAVLYRKKKNDI